MSAEFPSVRVYFSFFARVRGTQGGSSCPPNDVSLLPSPLKESFSVWLCCPCRLPFSRWQCISRSISVHSPSSASPEPSLSTETLICDVGLWQALAGMSGIPSPSPRGCFWALLPKSSKANWSPGSPPQSPISWGGSSSCQSPRAGAVGLAGNGTFAPTAAQLTLIFRRRTLLPTSARVL